MTINNIEDVFQLVRLIDNEEFFKLIEDIDINMLNSNKQNLLQEAITYENDTIGLELIKRGIDLNNKDNKGQTPLHYCAVSDNYELAKNILEQGGDVNILDNYGNNALWTAVFNARGKYEIVNLYMKFNADSELKNNAGRSSVDFAIQIKDEELTSILSVSK